MRKFWFLAALLTVSTVMPVQSADRGVDDLLRELGKEKAPAKKPVYSMRSPTYSAMTRQDIIDSSIHYEKMKTEARSRKLNYALVGLASLFGTIAVFSFVSARRRKIVSGVDAAFIGTLATVVSAKRSLGSKIEARIASKARSSTDG
ncbi:hypothetical protein NKH72_13485 [Mesorhizobium sp. M0955]|uniref:hypothetical protein n=1 Tax=Mesorhizobium sp. M0955 TaxID=2957033 RepID=UPI0033370A9F